MFQYCRIVGLITFLPAFASASFILGVAKALGLEVAQVDSDENLGNVVGGEAENLGLQRPVLLRNLPIDATFMVNSRLYRTNNMFKSEQDDLIDDSSIFELGGTLSMTVPEVTFLGYKATPSLNLTHMRFFNAKLAEILDFETQIVAASMGLQITDTLMVTPGFDYNRMISPGGDEHKFHGTGASLMAMKMIPSGEKGMWMIMGGGKWNWTNGDALINPENGQPVFFFNEITEKFEQARAVDEQDRWDANLNVSYMWNLPNGVVVTPNAGIAMSNYLVNLNDGRRDITYTLGA
ncbi:MAG: hypothetical protein VB855_15225, partial [Pirellulaceae bacterium]